MKNAPWLVAGLLGALIAAAASGDELITYYWEINDTGSNTATIEPGETVTLNLLAAWAPSDYMFGSASYGIEGVENWETGEILQHWNLIDDLGTGPGELQPNNDILGIESFALPPFFGDYAHYSPSWVYWIEWAPSDYTPRTVRVTDVGHPLTDLWIDDFGTPARYEAAPSEGATIFIVPAPGGVLAIVLGGLMLARRRYRVMP